MTTDTVTITHVPRTDLAAVRIQTPASGIPEAMSEAFQALYSLLGRRGIAPAGPPTAIYDAFGEDEVRARIAIPIAAPIEPPIEPEEAVYADELPEGDLATAEHLGAYDTLASTYEHLQRWLDDHGYDTLGPPRERYLNGPGEVSPSELRTLVDFPVRERASAHGANGS
jgi:effector-binding domain-containing protein